ncbi:MAG: hypothetical protein WA092_01285 [Minisyncoccales bacterium]
MEEEKLKILLDSIRDRYDFITTADNAIEAKAGILLGFEIAIIIGFSSSIVVGLNGIKLAEGILGIVLLALSIVLLLVVTWPRSYNAFSVNIFEHKDYFEKTEKDLLNQMISDSHGATIKNKQKLENKAKVYKWSMFLLIGSIFLITLSKLSKFYV